MIPVMSCHVSQPVSLSKFFSLDTGMCMQTVTKVKVQWLSANATLSLGLLGSDQAEAA